MKTIDYYMSLPYRIEIIPDAEEGEFTAWYPNLPGCLTCSATFDGILSNAKDAKKAWLTAALEDGIAIAEPTEEPDVSDFSGQFRLRMPRSLHKRLAIGVQLFDLFRAELSLIAKSALTGQPFGKIDIVTGLALT